MTRGETSWGRNVQLPLSLHKKINLVIVAAIDFDGRTAYGVSLFGAQPVPLFHQTPASGVFCLRKKATIVTA